MVHKCGDVLAFIMFVELVFASILALKWWLMFVNVKINVNCIYDVYYVCLFMAMNN